MDYVSATHGRCLYGETRPASIDPALPQDRALLIRNRQRPELWRYFAAARFERRFRNDQDPGAAEIEDPEWPIAACRTLEIAGIAAYEVA